MSDALAITARELLRSAEKERDAALYKVRQLEFLIKRQDEEIARLQAELMPIGDRDAQRAEFAERLVEFLWRKINDAVHDEDPDTGRDQAVRWLEYRLQQWGRA